MTQPAIRRFPGPHRQPVANGRRGIGVGELRRALDVTDDPCVLEISDGEVVVTADNGDMARHLVHRGYRRGRIVLTRHGALATERVRVVAAPARPWLWMMIGSAILGTGVALLIRAELGLPPYDVLLSAIARGFGITHGQAGWVLAGGLLVVSSSLGRRPRLATVGFILCNGIAIDAALPLLHTPVALPTRIVFSVAGTCAIAAGVALVIHSGGTGGAFELIIKALGDRGLQPIPVRTTMEFTTLAAGLALAGDAGIVTLAFACAFGPLVVASVRALEDLQVGRELRLTARQAEMPSTRAEGVPMPVG